MGGEGGLGLHEVLDVLLVDFGELGILALVLRLDLLL